MYTTAKKLMMVWGAVKFVQGIPRLFSNVDKHEGRVFALTIHNCDACPFRRSCAKRGNVQCFLGRGVGAVFLHNRSAKQRTPLNDYGPIALSQGVPIVGEESIRLHNPRLHRKPPQSTITPPAYTKKKNHFVAKKNLNSSKKNPKPPNSSGVFLVHTTPRSGALQPKSVNSQTAGGQAPTAGLGLTAASFFSPLVCW